MAEVVILPLATNDLEEIWSVIAFDSPRAADRMVHRIVQRMGALEQFPELGPRRPDLGTNVRILIEHPYIVPYRYETGKRVEVIRVLHGARDLFDEMDGID